MHARHNVYLTQWVQTHTEEYVHACGKSSYSYTYNPTCTKVKKCPSYLHANWHLATRVFLHPPRAKQWPQWLVRSRENTRTQGSIRVTCTMINRERGKWLQMTTCTCVRRPRRRAPHCVGYLPQQPVKRIQVSSPFEAGTPMVLSNSSLRLQYTEVLSTDQSSNVPFSRSDSVAQAWTPSWFAIAQRF